MTKLKCQKKDKKSQEKTKIIKIKMRMWRLMAHGWSFKANCRGKSYSEIGSFSYKP